MKFNDTDSFQEKSLEILAQINKMFVHARPVFLQELTAGNTALVIVDMVNGFTREGALKSGRIEALIPEITALLRKCGELGIAAIAFADNHTGSSPEFSSYPPHCLDGTREAEMVDEIKKAGGYKRIAKNSTNGFLEEEFQDWMKKNGNIDTFIITGDCTDICIQQFAVTLKTWFNMQDRKSRIIVPVDLVETYDLELHYAGLVNLMALYNMHINGVEIAAAIIAEE